MIGMDEYGYIRTAKRVYKKSIKEICRDTGLSRNTVRKALRNEPGRYRRRRQQPYRVLGPYLQVIDQWLEADKESPKKQRHTAKRIFDRLRLEYDFNGSESTVRHYVQSAKIRLGVQVAKAFIPLEPDIGREAEVDWGTAVALIGDQATPIKFFCMRSKYSGKHFVRCYPCERQQAFFDGHVQAFAFFGGIFQTLIYDNLTPAVQKVLRGRQRLEQEAFTKFHAYYNFTPCFCNPASGHEKGGVEGLVGYVKRNYLVPVPQGESLAEINEKILAQCLNYVSHRIQGREGTVDDLFEAEKGHLMELPGVPFSNLHTRGGKVDSYATVIVDKNRYSVPTRYVGLKVTVNLYVGHLEIFYAGKKIAEHQRVYGNNKWQLDPDHYLEIIQQRPYAFQAARPIRQWREHWPPVFEKLLLRFQESQGNTDGIKDFISVLMLYRDYPEDEIHAAVELGLRHGISSSAGIKHLLLKSEPEPDVTSLPDWPATETPDVAKYAQLGGTL